MRGLWLVRSVFARLSGGDKLRRAAQLSAARRSHSNHAPQIVKNHMRMIRRHADIIKERIPVSRKEARFINKALDLPDEIGALGS